VKRENAAAAGRLFQQKEKNLQKDKGFFALLSYI